MSSEPLLSTRTNDLEAPPEPSFHFQPNEGGYLLPQLSIELKKESLNVVQKEAWRRTRIVQWGHQKIIHPFVLILRRGLEPKLLSLSAALGLTFGVFPICGVPILLCAIAAAVLQTNCHVPTIMLANLLVSPFELGLVVPFMRVGESVTGAEHFLIPSHGLWEAIRGCQPRALMFGMLHAVIGWTILAPVSIAVLYITFLPVFRYLIWKFGKSSFLRHQVPVNDSGAVKT